MPVNKAKSTSNPETQSKKSASEKPGRRSSLGPPIHLPFSVDYAPTARAKCKKCGSTIQKDAPRFCRKVNSPWHDGVDVQLNHLECGTKWAKDLESIHYLGWLTWDDFLKAADVWEVEVPLSNPAVKTTRTLLKSVTAVREAIADLDAQSMFGDIMRHNGLPLIAVEKFRGPVHAHIIADSLLRGLTPPCPICQRNSLVGAGEALYCVSQCDFYVAWSPVGRPKSPYDDILSKDVLEGLKKRSRDYRIMSKANNLKWERVSAVMKELVKQHPKLMFRTDIKFDDTPYPEEDQDQRSEKAVKRETEKDSKKGALSILPKIKSSAPLLQIDQDYQERVKPGGTRRSCIYVDNKNNAYSVYLTLSDAFSGKNSFYTIQLVKSYLPTSASRRKRKQQRKRNGGDDNKGNLSLRKKKKSTERKANDTGREDDESEHEDDMRSETIDESDDEEDEELPVYIDNSHYSDGAWQSHLDEELAKFHVLKKWGRVGGEVEDRGNGCSIDAFNDNLDQALKMFKTKYRELSGLSFEDRYQNVKDIPGKYRFTDLAGHCFDDSHVRSRQSHGKPSSSKSAQQGSEDDKGVTKCNLSKEVQHLLSVVFDDQTLRESLNEMDVDALKVNLESLSARQLTTGYALLTDIEKLVDQLNQHSDKLERSRIYHKIKLATSEFYTIVPRSFKRNEIPPPIDSINQIKAETILVQDLIELATSVEAIKTADKLEQQHPELSWYDRVYSSIPMNITAEKKTSEAHKLVTNLVKTGHAITHSSFTLSVNGVYRLEPKDRAADQAREKLFQQIGNKMLLWHGSRLSNWAGILTQGLSIAPPQAPKSGYMFDKGVYFADIASKSALYAGASPNQTRGYLLLCEVALGDQHLLLNADTTAAATVAKLKRNSTQGVGRTAPDRSKSKYIRSYYATETNDISYVEQSDKMTTVEVLWGPQIDNQKQIKAVVSNDEKSEDAPHNPTLFYNEYVIYDTTQVMPRFLVEVEFTYKTVGQDDSDSESRESERDPESNSDDNAGDDY